MIARITFFICLLLFTGVWECKAQDAGKDRSGAEPKLLFVNQIDAPLKLSGYSVEWLNSEHTRVSVPTHSIEFKNTSKREIVAVQIGFVFLGIWNEYLDTAHGFSLLSLEPDEESSRSWIIESTKFSSAEIFTGIAYVNRIRFANGEAWKANPGHLLKELRKIEKSSEESMITERKPQIEELRILRLRDQYIRPETPK